MKHKSVVVAFYITLVLALSTGALALAALLGYSYTRVLCSSALLTIASVLILLHNLSLLRTREKILLRRESEAAEIIKHLKDERNSFEEEKRRFDAQRAGFVEEIDALRTQIRDFVARDKTQSHHLENLTALREIHHAASLEHDFERILYEVMSRINDFMAGDEATLFLLDDETAQPVPQAYYKRGETIKLFAFFNYPIKEESPAFIGKPTVREKNSLVGALLLGEQVVGSITITVPGHSRTSRATLEEIFTAQVDALSIDSTSVFDAVEFNNIFHVSTDGALDIVMPLLVEGTVIGVFKIRTHPSEEEDFLENYEERLRVYLREISVLIRREELREKTVRDGLTRLYNKSHFLETIDEMLSTARTSKKPFSLIMLDIDHFKKVNDTFGHLTGDIVLRKVAALLREGMRSERDIVCRYGGEEMSVLLPETDRKGAKALADRLRESVEQESFFSVDGKEVPVTISAGVAQFEPEIKKSDELITLADDALYHAKETGRNRVCAAGEDTEK